jgi:hypothetical protein
MKAFRKEVYPLTVRDMCSVAMSLLFTTTMPPDLSLNVQVVCIKLPDYCLQGFYNFPLFLILQYKFNRGLHYCRGKVWGALARRTFKDL